MENSTSVNDNYKSLKDDCARRSNGMIIKDSSSVDPYYWSWKNNNNSCDQDGSGDLLGGFSWPPRSYTCTFCKREFKSAQALGGHMNVHRRDRARLRQMPSAQTLMSSSSSSSYTTLLNLNLHPSPNPNPNPSFSPYFSSSLSSSATPKMLAPMMSSSPPSSSAQHHNSPYLSSPRSSAYPRTGGSSLKYQIPSFRVCKFDGFPCDEDKIGNRSENIVRLNLEIGLLGDSESDDLDLELRLGCA